MNTPIQPAGAVPPKPVATPVEPVKEQKKLTDILVAKSPSKRRRVVVFVGALAGGILFIAGLFYLLFVTPVASNPTTVEATVPDTKYPAKATKDITIYRLRNNEYTVETNPVKKATFKDGISYVEPKLDRAVTEADRQQWYYQLDETHVVIGDLNGDHVDDAAVVIKARLGTDMIYYRLCLVKNDNGVLTNTKTIDLGDRVKIDTFAIKEGQAHVVWTAWGTDQKTQDQLFGL